jgi:methyl-accepting chemotaxis protein
VHEVDASSTAIATAITEQDHATKAIERTIMEAVRFADLAAEGVAAVRADAIETVATACILLESADGMSAQAQRVQGEVQQFLAVTAIADSDNHDPEATPSDVQYGEEILVRLTV